MQGKKFTPQLFRERLIDDEKGCWVWNGPTDADGYGKTWYQGRSNVRVHRIAYELWVGDIPPGMMVLHKCDNPPCGNPKHLFLGTHLDNMRDAVKKGRKYKGVKNPNVKLTEYQVSTIHQMYAAGVSMNKLSLIFNVTRRTIHNIIHGKSWEEFRQEQHVVESTHEQEQADAARDDRGHEPLRVNAGDQGSN